MHVLCYYLVLAIYLLFVELQVGNGNIVVILLYYHHAHIVVLYVGIILVVIIVIVIIVFPVYVFDFGDVFLERLYVVRVYGCLLIKL